MKALLRKSLPLALGIIAILWPTACRRMTDITIPASQINEKVVVKSNVYVLDTTRNDQLLQLTKEYLLFKESPSVRNGRLAASFRLESLRQGDILLGYPSQNAPNGFWAKIESISQIAEGLKINFSTPTFLDLFEELEKKWQVSYGTGAAEVTGNGERDSWLWKGKFPIKIDTPLKDDNDNIIGKGEGSVSISAGAQVTTEYELVIEKSKWKKIRIETKVKKALKAAYELAGTVSFEDKWNFVCHNFKPYIVPGMPIPVVIRPVLRVDVGAELSGTMKIGGEVTALEEESSVGVYYDGNNWNEIKTEQKNPVTSSPSAEVSGKIEGWAEVVGQGYFYQFFTVDCKKEPDVELSFGIGVRAFIGAQGQCKFMGQGDSEIKTYYGVEGKMFAKLEVLDVLNFKPEVGLKWQVDNSRNVNWSICKGKQADNNPVINEVEEASTSVSTADPHMTSFDNLRYDFMAVGEFVAAKSTTNNFQVQVRQSPYPNSTQVSVNTGIAIQTGSDRICAYPNPNRLYVNNQTIPLTFTTYALNSGGSIQNNNGRLTITNNNGDRVEIRLLATDLDYFITPAKNRKGQLSGLFGNYDGSSSNDLVQADGKTVSSQYNALYPAFADSWRIKQTESLFVYETDKTTDSYTDRNFPRSEIQLTASQSAAAEQICRQAGVTDPDALKGCIVDVALTGNQSFAERAKQNEIISNAKNILSVSNFSQYRNEFVLSSGATVNGSTVLLGSKGTIGWNDAYLNRNGYETEIVLAVNAPSPCFPLFDIEVIDNQSTGDPNQNYLRLSANASKTQIELVNSGVQPQLHSANLFDGNRHRIRIATSKTMSGSQTTVRMLVYLDNYDPLTIERSYASSSLAGYLYPMLKNETLNCTNGQITIIGWAFRSL